MAQKWIPLLKEYIDYILPAGATMYENDMNKIVACARCKCELPFGDTYTSRQIHTTMGFGYSVCSDCYELEWEEEHLANEET